MERADNRCAAQMCPIKFLFQNLFRITAKITFSHLAFPLPQGPQVPIISKSGDFSEEVWGHGEPHRLKRKNGVRKNDWTLCQYVNVL